MRISRSTGATAWRASTWACACRPTAATTCWNLLRAPEFVEYAHRASWPDPILVRLGQNGQERLMMMQLTAYASNQRLLITRDVTQIERLETTRRDFVANVSHSCARR